MGKGYTNISYHDYLFRKQLNDTAAENRYNDLLHETYRQKEQDYKDFLSEYDPKEYESSLGLIGDDW